MGWRNVKAWDRVVMIPLDDKKPTITGFVREVDPVSRAFVTINGCGSTRFHAGDYSMGHSRNTIEQGSSS